MANQGASVPETEPQQFQAAANLFALIESTEDLIWSIDLEYRILTFNSALKRHIERNFGTLISVGKRPEDLLPAQRAAIWPPLFQQAIDHGPFRSEIPFPENRILEMSFHPIVVDGKVTGLSMFGKDVTERKRAEELVRESRDSLREAQAIGGVGSYELDISANRWTGSEVMDQIFGIDEDDPHTMDAWSELLHPDDTVMMREYSSSVMAGEVARFDKEYRIVRPRDGVVRWLHGMGKVEFDSQGCPVRLRGMIKDVTERKQAYLDLEQSEERYRSTFEQAPLGIIHASAEGRLLRCNARFAEIVGYTLDEILHLTLKQICSPEDMAALQKSFQSAVGPGHDSARFEGQFSHKDGSLIWVRISVSAQFDIHGNVVHHIALVEDVDALKAAEQQLTAVQMALRHSEERYRTAFQTSIDAINLNRLSDGEYVDVNQAFLDIIGFKREEVIGRTSIDLKIWAEPEDRERMVELVLRHGSCRDFEAQFRTKDERLFWGRMSASIIEIDGTTCILSITRDITLAKAAALRIAEAARALRLSEERYRKVFQTSLDPITISRLDNEQYLDVNDTFLEVMGYRRDEIIGRTSLDLQLWKDPRDRNRFALLLNRDKECRNLEFAFLKKNGETIWGLISASITEIDGIPCVLAITRDISNAKAAEDEIRNLAFYDSLTGLPNRRLLLDKLQIALATIPRTSHLRALLFVDLDNFKTLNDTLGHQTGDLMLQEAAKRLTACAGEVDTIGRLGGDEFVLMLEGLSPIPEEAAAEAKAAGEKLLSVVSQPYLLNGHECRSSASIGISVFGGQRESSKEVLQQADIAMYQAKAAGRNTLRFFAPALQAAVNAHAALEEELRQGINEGQFLLYFQPQVDRNRLAGAEALIRWNHPTRSLLPPAEFIPMAEETGLIVAMGKWVLEEACRQIAAWAGNRQSAKLALAVNISARQFRQPDFVEQILDVLESTGANPRNLRLELTESILVENVQDVIDKMKALKEKGLRFSLDDFGTGYSSLAYLKKLPLDQIKIDRSFIRDILVDESSAAIAQTIVSLSRAMGLPVIAEGVETEEQRVFLTRMGCHAFQGYLFSRPLPLNEFEAQWFTQAETRATPA